MLPPLPNQTLEQLKYDAMNIRETAMRKTVTLDAWEEKSESFHAKNHFELGCWLYFYANQISLDGKRGLEARVECLHTILKAGFSKLNYEFFTVFNFGERQFDTIFEMGDANEVIQRVKAKNARCNDQTVAQMLSEMRL